MAITTANQLRNGMGTNRSDWVNIVLIVFACSAAHAFPWQTLIVAYAVLGPGHYLTEVSWLHDRQYFACSRWYLPCACILAALLTVAAFVRGPLTPWLACALLLLSLFVALIDAGGWKRAALIATAGAAIVASIPAQLSAIALAIAVLLPTVVHVFVFTAAFMMKGARRSGGELKSEVVYGGVEGGVEGGGGFS